MILNYATVLSGKYLHFLIEGAGTNLELTLLAWLIAVPLALALAGLRASPSRVGRTAAVAFVEYHRSVPLLIQLLVWYFAISELLPSGLNDAINESNSELIFATLALSLYSAAYMSEDLRSGLRSIPGGQMDAARGLGWGYAMAMRLVILPQAWRAAVPPLASQLLVLFKATSLASAIGVAELTYQARQIESQTFLAFEAFSAVTIIYVIGTASIMLAGGALSRRVSVVGRSRA